MEVGGGQCRPRIAPTWSEDFGKVGSSRDDVDVRWAHMGATQCDTTLPACRLDLRGNRRDPVNPSRAKATKSTSRSVWQRGDQRLHALLHGVEMTKSMPYRPETVNGPLLEECL